MYKRIDGPKIEYDGYSYLNKNGKEETVSKPCTSGVVEISDSCDGKTEIYHQDIPKLILALQAAYDHKE